MIVSKATLRFLALFAALGLLVAACGDGGSPDEAAIVNGESIPMSEFEERYETLAENPQFQQQLEMDESGAMEAQIQSQVLTQLIHAELLRQAADEMGVDVDEDDLDEQRDLLAEQVEAQGMDLEEAMEQQGLEEEDLQEELRTVALQQAIIDELLAEEGGVSDEDVAEFFEENQEQYQTAEARHVLTESEEEAEEARERIEDGEDFGEVAEDMSEDPGSAEEGGELEPFSPGEFQNPEFEDAVFEADEGDLVGPVESQVGWHVIEVLELVEPELADVEDEIREELEGSEEMEIFQSWFSERLQEAEVEINPRFGEWDAEAGQVIPDVDEEDKMMPGAPQEGAPQEGAPQEGAPPEGEDLEDVDEEQLEELEEELQELEEQSEE